MGETLGDFFYVLLFFVVAVLFTIVPVVISLLIAPRSRGLKTTDIYECGMEPFGSAWIRYSVLFYLYALIFIAFDVDVLYLFPVATSYVKGGRTDEFLSLLVFLLLLLLAIAYAWGKGVFEWRREGR